jgi:hypothetical protein
MKDVKDGGNAAKTNDADKGNGQEPKTKKPRTATKPKAETATAKKDVAKPFERKVAKGYKSPIEEHWDTLVDSESKNYAFLEVEQRAFSPVTGQKTSRPSVVSYNRPDFVTFTGHGIQKADKGQEQAVSMKQANGFSINAVLYIPPSFNIDVDVDEWPSKE